MSGGKPTQGPLRLWNTFDAHDPERDRLMALNAEMLAALRLTKRMIDEALPKFNWGASALDANAVMLLNETPGAVNAAIRKAEGGAA